MQILNLAIFAALIIGFLVLFLAPGRWWPHRPRHPPLGERRDDPIPDDPLSPQPCNTPDKWN